ncbi:hypothetical protein EXIGLDRAFT_782989 [Exidia glandulosa HHB12029]|uniref:Tet-like 2OG-Fe(II) oxygenase domain-containing protein n=1 Tax=Exidia glandulosa HHB12029 TaxID=1314781 RepID=A0A165Z373_EXIGL|nr:hypothetical protein EXIGLDRAFT_782989 [Exidia glandulosa HHB12029]
MDTGLGQVGTPTVTQLGRKKKNRRRGDKRDEARRTLANNTTGASGEYKTTARFRTANLPEGLRAGDIPTRDVIDKLNILGNVEGTLVLLDSSNGQPVALLRVTLLAGMSPEERADCQKLATFFHSVPGTVYPVGSNGPHKAAKKAAKTSTGNPSPNARSAPARFRPRVNNIPRSVHAGYMYAIGWRRGYETLVRLGLYKPAMYASMAEDKMRQVFENFIRVHEELPDIADIYRRRFNTLAPLLLKHNESNFKGSNIPSLSNVYDTTLRTGYLAASNLTITMRDFYNMFHTDRDSTTYTYGIWIHTYEDGSGLVERDEDVVKGITGGEFFLSEWKTAIRFQRAALYEIIWRGPCDLHGTAPSTTKGNVLRWGSSVQVASSLEQAAATLAAGPSSLIAGLDDRIHDAEHLLGDGDEDEGDDGDDEDEGDDEDDGDEGNEPSWHFGQQDHAKDDPPRRNPERAVKTFAAGRYVFEVELESDEPGDMEIDNDDPNDLDYVDM